MKHLAIQLLNWLFLAIIFIGVPAVSSLKLGSIQISSRPVWHMLVLWGVFCVCSCNAFFIWKSRSKKEKRTARGWLFGYVLMGSVFYGYSEGWIRFKWLKSGLLFIKGLFS